MGRLIVRQVSMQKDMKLVAAIDSPGNLMEGKDAGLVAGVAKLDVKILGSDKLGEILRSSKPDVLVDFTVAEASVQDVKVASKAGVSVVVGTTGFTQQQGKEMEEAIKRGKIRAVISPNFSVGVNVFFKAARDAARLLGKDYEPSIVEIHHVHKKDAPSGTALRMAEVIAGALGRDLSRVAVYGRQGTPGERTRDEIGLLSLRSGDVVGEHTVTFGNLGERLELTHRAHSRDTFARGAIRAARFIAGAPPGLYSMQDVLGLK